MRRWAANRTLVPRAGIVPPFIQETPMRSRLLLLLPFLGLLAVTLFNSESPEFLGLPFFYWYMFAWVPLTSFLIWIVYRNERTED
jgi:hypothetical protein